MSQDEVVAVLKARHNEYTLISQTEWEQVRLICYYNVIAFGAKVKEPKELFKFDWDDKQKKDIKTIDKEEALKRLQTNRKNRYINSK